MTSLSGISCVCRRSSNIQDDALLCYDSARVYYIDDINRYMQWDTQLYLRHKKYDKTFIVRDSSHIDSLYKYVKVVSDKDSLFYRKADAHIVVLGFHNDRTDTLSFDCGPFVSEINGIPYSDKQLFKWVVNRIAEYDSAWGKQNIKDLILTKEAIEVFKYPDKSSNNPPVISEFIADSIKVFYTYDFNADRFSDIDARTFVRSKAYDSDITVLNHAYLESLHHIINKTIKQNPIEKAYLDAFIVVLSYAKDKADTLSLSNVPCEIEIDRAVYPDKEVFWQVIDIISKLDSVWTDKNSSWVSSIDCK